MTPLFAFGIAVAKEKKRLPEIWAVKTEGHSTLLKAITKGR